jgi:hypothetical protein
MRRYREDSKLGGGTERTASYDEVQRGRQAMRRYREDSKLGGGTERTVSYFSPLFTPAPCRWVSLSQRVLNNYRGSGFLAVV